jgi:hypothetical protein
MRLTTTNRIALITLALALGFAPAWAAPGDEAGSAEPQVRIERKVICDGENCSEHDGAGHKAIFIDADGNQQAMDDVHHWMGADGAEHMKMMMLGGGKGGFLGVGLTDLTAELRAHFGVPETAGVMVSKVVSDSPAERAGIQVGDIITLVDADEVTSGAALAHVISSQEKGTDVTLELWRDGRAQKLTATLDEHEAPAMARMPLMHRMHGAAGHGGERHMMIECEGENCGAGAGSYDCGGAEECEVRVECQEGGCTCTVNGANTDCAEIPGVPTE